jgi:hypothetical protein
MKIHHVIMLVSKISIAGVKIMITYYFCIASSIKLKKIIIINNIDTKLFYKLSQVKFKLCLMWQTIEKTHTMKN